MTEAGEVQTTTIAAKERGPGPGRYGLPSTMGFQAHDFSKRMNPAYSFGKRLSNTYADDCSPGPIYYNNPRITKDGMDGTPAYSILGQQKDPLTFKTPAPGAYSPEKVHPQGERHAPSYSMGARSRFRKRDPTPSPNSYTLPSLLGSKVPNKHSSASFSMTSRAKTGGFSEDLAKTPGPGRYRNVDPSVTKRKSPAYSMNERNFMPGDATQKPGPGAHSPEKVEITRLNAPTFSLGIRHSEYITPLICECND